MTEQIPDWMIPDPWEIEEDERRRHRWRDPAYRAKRREYNQRPEVKARAKEYAQRPEVKERMRAYHREYQRTRRAARRAAERALLEDGRVGGLHELGCTGPHKNHKACRVIPVYRREDAA